MNQTASVEPRPTRPTGAFGVCYALFLRSQATRARLASLLAMGVLGVIIGLAIGASDAVDPIQAGAHFITAYGLALLVPVTTLVFASAVFGDLREDGSMVYLWLHPVSPRVVTLAAYLSSVTVVLPVVVIPLGVAAALTGGGGDLIAGTVAAASMAVVVYGALFLALGLRVQRALVWGLVYILLLEGFVAQAGSTPAKVALRTYTQAILTDAAGTEPGPSPVGFPWTILVPVAVVVVALAYTTWRFRHQDVA
jgi:ABC-2 type transport system permease protein